MPRVLLVLVILGVTIYALIDCLRTERGSVRTLPKPAWILLIVLLPAVGAALWFFLGRPRRQAGPARPARSVAPDDDPDFLRNLEIHRRQKAEEQRLEEKRRELEERERKLGGDEKP
ncbi:PLDc N-terminal domain-containing protein [Acaricomes phytoseiuli]|uniref:PLD nuclease N-terminal domain-containing protein n=1 Tax=Acaricomes phytoseiuli TaxID=291968 RepID=UPI0003A2B75E|nr:PLD nuclease N-terminal domain-containing protein [Acaricomes phytoseiuli]MCW1250058.1 PLDc N-terminal domain-containing protein [Acaricomes phytoseiuli]